MTVLILTLGLFVAGCTTGIAYRIPIIPPSGQPAAQTERDVAECEVTASPGMDKRGLAYASCMIQRGYSAWVEVPIWSLFGEASTAYMVSPTAPHTAGQVVADVNICGQQVDKQARPGVGSRAVMGAVGVFLSGVPISAADTEAIDRVYRQCMTARGYRVEVWRP